MWSLLKNLAGALLGGFWDKRPKPLKPFPRPTRTAQPRPPREVVFTDRNAGIERVVIPDGLTSREYGEWLHALIEEHDKS